MPILGVFTRYELERFKIAKNYIESHYRFNCSAEQIAEEVKVDIKLLRKGIMFLTGSTIHNYIKRIRLEKAMEDLSDFKISIKHIAGKHGFSSSSHFGFEFKKWTGKTPSQYRVYILLT